MKKAGASGRYVHLDALRGILAIAVVIHHFSFATRLDWFNKAWISVDAFFILSGFVIAHSYQGKLAAGMGLREFSVARLARLYPLYFVGLLLGVLALLGSPFQPAPAPQEQATAIGFGLLVLPYLNGQLWPAIAGGAQGSVFPLNEPAWSLFYELFVNLVFFAWVRHGRMLAAAAVALIFGIAHVLAAQHYGLHSGWAASNFAGGFIRVIFFFFLGVAIYALHGRLALRSIWPFALGTAALLVGFMFRSVAIDYLLLFLVAPLTILLGSRVRAGGARAAGLMSWLGSISYPIYIIHFPLGMMLHATALGELAAPQFVLISTVVSLAAADLAARGEKFARSHWRQRAPA
ncbi:MAG: acyltransferase [Burkholderiaceae bacterium]